MERLVLPAKLDNLEKMFDFIRAGASRQGFDSKKINAIQLACEEALVNVINYAYPGTTGDLEITYETTEKILELKIIDSGIPFNPLTLVTPDINAPLEERKVGGLGVYMMRTIMDDIQYARENGRNILTMKKSTDCSCKPVVAAPDSCFRWPLAYMKKEEYKSGDLLFKAGDKADKMFYIRKGSIRLLEINKVIPAGQVIGEMGLFSVLKERTASAIVEEDLEAYTMGKEEVIHFFGEDPTLAIDLIQLSVERFIENLKAETAARERMESELRIAHEIQNSMLPQVFPKAKEFEIYATMDPAKEVGGDFYDFFFVNEKKFCFSVGDVSGKGVPAALFMAITKALLKTEALRGLPPDEIMASVNNTLCPDNQTCLFVTVFLAILDLETGSLCVCNAGHNPPVLCRAGGTTEFLNVSGGFVVGVMEHMKFEKREILLQPNDLVLLYTDGVTEAMNPQREMFSDQRLRQIMEKLQDKNRETVVNSLRIAIAKFAQAEPQSDDITMLALRFTGKGA